MKALPNLSIEYDNLKKAVDEINEQFDLEPKIPTKSVAQMRKDVLETMCDDDGDLFEGEEEFTKATIDVLGGLEIDVSDFKVILTDKKEEKKMVATKTKKAGKKTGEKVIVKKEKIVKGKKVIVKEVKKKVTQKKVSSNGKVKGIGKYVVENLKKKKFKNMTNQEIADAVRDKFESNTKATCISWYKQKIKKGLM